MTSWMISIKKLNHLEKYIDNSIAQYIDIAHSGAESDHFTQ